MNMLILMIEWLLLKRRNDDWRYVSEPPNWACRRHGLDYLYCRMMTMRLLSVSCRPRPGLMGSKQIFRRM